MAWADREYPQKKGKDLSKGERDLAVARADHVAKVLKGFGVSKIEMHSMAEHPSWIAKTFNTDDAKLKGEGKTNALDDAAIERIGRQIRLKGGPSTAVVMVRREGKLQSH